MSSLTENITNTASEVQGAQPAPSVDASQTNVAQQSPDAQQTQNVNLLGVVVDNENTALNLLVGFLGVAQRRGVFAINESAKIHECVMMFQKNQ